MTRWKAWLGVGLLALGGFFETGCTSLRGAGGEVAQGALEKGKEWLKAELATAIPSLEEKAISAVEKKMAEKEAQYYSTLDKELAALGSVDPATGAKVAKTWQDFDIDKSGKLEALELMRLALYVKSENDARLKRGEITQDQANQSTKNVGLASGGIGLLALGAAGVTAVRRRKAPAATATATKPTPTEPPKPASATG